MISVALRLKVGASPTTCCLITCWVIVEPPLAEPIPTTDPRVARKTALGTTPLWLMKFSSSVAITAFFTFSEIAELSTVTLSRSLSIVEIKLPSAYVNSEIADIF